MWTSESSLQSFKSAGNCFHSPSLHIIGHKTAVDHKYHIVLSVNIRFDKSPYNFVIQPCSKSQLVKISRCVISVDFISFGKNAFFFLFEKIQSHITYVRFLLKRRCKQLIVIGSQRIIADGAVGIPIIRLKAMAHCSFSAAKG